MRIRHRENINIEDLMSLVNMVKAIKVKVQKQNKKSFFSPLFNQNSTDRKFIHQFEINLNDFLKKEDNTQNDVFRFYISQLKQLHAFILDPKNDEQLIREIECLLFLELKTLSESNINCEKFKDILKEINFAFAYLDNALDYDSIEHEKFCKKWKVSGELSDYFYWQILSNSIIGIHSQLSEKNYAKIIYQFILKFDIDSKEVLVESNDKEYGQLLFAMDEAKIKEDWIDKIPVSSLKPEIEIWRPDNLSLLMYDYLKNKTNEFNFKEMDKTLIEIKQIISHLMKEFINPVRLKLGLKEYDEKEIESMKKDLENQYHRLKVTIVNQSNKRSSCDKESTLAKDEEENIESSPSLRK